MSRSIRTLLLLAGLGLSCNSFAVDSDAERIEALEAQLQLQRDVMEQQQEMLEAMQSELERLKAGEPAVTTLPRDAAERNLDMPEKQAVDDDSGFELDLYGHVQLDAIYDFNRVDPTWESTLRPSTIPTVDGEFGSDGQTIISVKQTQFGFRGATMTPLGQVKSWFEFDFFGTGSDAGDTKFNLRHAWIEVGDLSFGQTNSNFMDISIFPNVVDWWGPSGMVFNRNPQVRYTWGTGGGDELALALEKPNGSFNTGIFGEISPEFDDVVSTKTKYPDLTAHWRNEFDRGHLQIAGVLRRLEFETRGLGDANFTRKETGWGINVTGAFNTVGRDQLKLGVVYGEGISSFMNDGGVNLAPEDNDEVAVPVLGVTAYYDHYWSDQWSSSVGVSVNDADPRNQQSADEFDTGVYSSANLLYTPYPELLIGSEFLYGRHEDVGGRVGEDYRLQFTFKHKLGISF